MLTLSLILSSFIAGLLTFLAPCTLPLVPGYLAFISGSASHMNDPDKLKQARWKIFKNGIFFVIGFTIIFIIFGVATASLAQLLGPDFRLWLTRIGGVFIILFGLFMLNIINIPYLQNNYKFRPPKFLKMGKPTSSMIIGMAFGFGWTPCIGPILGTILTLAAVSSTAVSGGLLLAIFSLGLAAPFLLIAWGTSSAFTYVKRINKYSRVITTIGGLFIIFLGILMLMNNFVYLLSWGYQMFDFIHYDSLLDYL